MALVDPDHMQNFEIGIRYVTGGSGGRALDLDLGTGGAGEPGQNRGRGGEQLHQNERGERKESVRQLESFRTKSPSRLRYKTGMSPNSQQGDPQ